jgi:septum formation protein
LVDPAAIDETPLARELPASLAKRLALAKAHCVAGRHPDSIVIAADTVVACGRRILPKAEDERTARQCLTLLSGRRHRVLGGLAIIAPGGIVRQRLVTSIVTFKRLTGHEIESYIGCGEWRGKAGGYAIQGRAAMFVAHISGSYTNIVGLPLHETWALLSGLGYGSR